MDEFQEMKKTVEKIEVEKEVLSTLPKNNEKDEKKYLEKIKELEKEYEKYKKDIRKYLEENKETADTLVKKMIKAAQVRDAARKAREAARKGKGNRQEKILSGKLAPAQSKDRKLKELYLSIKLIFVALPYFLLHIYYLLYYN